MFTIFRVIAGIGLGGVMPNVIAYTTEFHLNAVRSAIVSFVFCGYSVGAMAAALTSRSLLTTAGWEPVFWLAGIPSLVLSIFNEKSYLNLLISFQTGKVEEAKKVLAKIDPTINVKMAIEFKNHNKEHQVHLLLNCLKKNVHVSTMMFWISCFSAFILIYSMSTWLTTPYDAGWL